MYFTKFPHPANFAYATEFDAASGRCRIDGEEIGVRFQAYEGQIFHLELDRPHGERGVKLLELNRPGPLQEAAQVSLGNDLSLSVEGVLEGLGFGVCGPAWMAKFRTSDEHRFFGLGEKTFGRLEVGKLRTKFWNVDAWADFHWAQWGGHPSDPYYFSLPYLIVERGGAFVGILIENPCAPFFDTGANALIHTNDAGEPLILAGAEDGVPSLWVIVGTSLAELTEKIQRLVGVTPRPPLWAIGFHQSRWGYAGESHLRELDAQFEKHGIPCDGLWLDIDYMRGFRVFTYSDEAFPNGVSAALQAVRGNRRRVVPIIDPGVKFEPGYEVYESGRKAKAFCQNPQGREYIGMVWPGQTVFPDFSQESAREWWSGYAKCFFDEGFDGAWLDMNDPSTGAVDPMGMLFQGGKLPHIHFHNQYALGMQMATHAGLRRSRPDSRPFLLSRSGWIGTSRYAAIWTGDNVANRFYLKGSIPTAVNMNLSGLPFCGPDIGGFGGDTTPDLFQDWIKACFLFPFFRNHSSLGTRQQEPWALGKETLEVSRRYIRLRYRLLPYLYNLFVAQEETGAPILRPLIHDFEGAGSLDDQFMVGSAVLQAPHLDEGQKERVVELPGQEPWFDASDGKWVKPGRRKVARAGQTTPLYFRHRSIVPMRAGEPTATTTDLREVEFHVFVQRGSASYRYVADDGETMAYREGAVTEVAITARAGKSRLDLTMEVLRDGFGPVPASFVVYGDWDVVTVNGQRARKQRTTVRLTGGSISAWRIGA